MIPRQQQLSEHNSAARKEVSITHRERIDSDSVLRTEVEDQPMRAATDFNHASIRFDGLERLESLTHAPRRSRHRADDLFFAPAQVFCLALLVGELARQGSLRKFPLRRLSPGHLRNLCFFATGTLVLLVKTLVLVVAFLLYFFVY